MPNKHGLKRHIPAEVKRVVRQRCQFGCVICGRGVYQYEHFEPEFSEAEVHDPDGITLLCGTCHDKKTRGFLSTHAIKEANSSPYCVKYGGAFDNMETRRTPPEVQIGRTTFKNCNTILRIHNQRIIWFSPSRDGEPRLLFNIRILSDTGDVIFEVIDNEWTVGSDAWDVEASGGTITIKSEKNEISLELKLIPPRRIVIRKANIRAFGRRLEVLNTGEIYDHFSRSTFVGQTVSNFETAINFTLTGMQIGCGPFWAPPPPVTMNRFKNSTALVSPSQHRSRYSDQLAIEFLKKLANEH